MKVLLASVEDISAFPEGSAKAYPKLGLLSLAAYLRRELPAELMPDLAYHDMLLEGFDVDRLAGEVAAFQADVLGISCLSFSQAAFHDVAAAVKRVRPDTLVVGGGPYASSLRASVLDDPNVDVLVFDEGEVTFLDLIASLQRGEPLANVRGIAFRDGDRVVTTRPRELVPSLDDLPLPAYDLIDFGAYTDFNPHLDTGGRFFPIVTSRGCPFRCIYCHDLHGKRTRFRSPDSVMAEIEHLYHHHGVSCFYVYDDIFNVKKERAKEICRRIIASDMDIAIDFLNGLRADLMDHELIDLMIEAGAYYFAYAIETATPRLQDLIEKHNKLDVLADTVEYTVRQGRGRCVVATYNMIGFPTETEDEVWNTIEFNRSLPHHIADVAVAIPQENTALFDLVESMNISLPSKRSPNYGSDVMLSASEKISPERLGELLGEFKRAFYDEDRRARLSALARQPPRTAQVRHLGGFVRGLMRMGEEYLGDVNVALYAGDAEVVRA
jgi:anaerobic magnesium-protoporphyrin IX monomethyl ester cyclase